MYIVVNTQWSLHFLTIHHWWTVIFQNKKYEGWKFNCAMHDSSAHLSRISFVCINIYIRETHSCWTFQRLVTKQNRNTPIILKAEQPEEVEIDLNLKPFNMSFSYPSTILLFLLSDVNWFLTAIIITIVIWMKIYSSFFYYIPILIHYLFNINLFSGLNSCWWAFD